MRQHQHLLGIATLVSGLLIALPARAAELKHWRFDSQQNQLVFTTDEAVRPRAQFLFGPPRIVVDLPSTMLGQPTVNQPIDDDSIREVRVGQVDNQTTRLVIELSPGYTIDPAQIVVRGTTTLDWVVELPPAQTEDSTSRTANRLEATPIAGAATQVERIRVTPDGFFISTRGASPNLTVEQISDTQILLQLDDATVDAAFTQETLPSSQFGLTAWEIEQIPGNVPTLQIAVTVQNNIAEWKALTSGNNGVVILPPRGVTIATQSTDPDVEQSSPQPPVTRRPSPAHVVTRPQPSTAPSPIQNRPEPTNPVRNGRLENITIAIDPGHGGRDPGAIGVGGLREKDVVSDIAYDVAEILKQLGAHVILTRSDDREIDLDPRVQIAERANADLFISIHANSISLERPDVNGLETYYYSSGFQLAEAIHDAILRQLNMSDRGVRQARFYVLRTTSMPAVLVETGFVTGAQDAQNFANPSWRFQMAQAIADGIMQYAQRNL